MIEIWMKDHLVSDINCNIVAYHVQKSLQRKLNLNDWITFSVGDTTRTIYN